MYVRVKQTNIGSKLSFNELLLLELKRKFHALNVQTSSWVFANENKTLEAE